MRRAFRSRRWNGFTRARSPRSQATLGAARYALTSRRKASTNPGTGSLSRSWASPWGKSSRSPSSRPTAAPTRSTSSCSWRPRSRSPARSARPSIRWRSSRVLPRDQRRAPIEVGDNAAQPELRHIDGVFGTLEDNRLPLGALGLISTHTFRGIDHTGREFVGGWGVGANFGVVPHAGFGGRHPPRPKQKAF